VLPQSDTEAFLWAQKAAEAGLAKAMYAVGYFLEVGIGTQANLRECVSQAFPGRASVPCLALTHHLLIRYRSISYYKRAAELGDKRAAQRLRGAPNQPLQHAPGGPSGVLRRGGPDAGDVASAGKGKDGKDCIIM
jgi:hypothetical protein